MGKVVDMEAVEGLELLKEEVVSKLGKAGVAPTSIVQGILSELTRPPENTL